MSLESNIGLWFAEGIHFDCRRCGMCCRGEPGFVWATIPEIEAMAKAVGMSADDFRKRYVRREGTRLSLKERTNGDCVMWREGCLVYEVRPAQCRTFPFWTGALRSKSTFEEWSRGCPGVGSGKLYTGEEVRAISRNERDT